MTRLLLPAFAALVGGLSLALAGCAQHTGTLPGTACCGMSCESTCWPAGRIGPVCPELCEEYAEPECPPPVECNTTPLCGR